MSEKLSDTWLELVSRWRRCFTPDQLVAFIEDVKNARWSDMGPLEAENAELKRAIVILYDDISDHLPDNLLKLVATCRTAVNEHD